MSCKYTKFLRKAHKKKPNHSKILSIRKQPILSTPSAASDTRSQYDNADSPCGRNTPS